MCRRWRFWMRVDWSSRGREVLAMNDRELIAALRRMLKEYDVEVELE